MNFIPVFIFTELFWVLNNLDNVFDFQISAN